MAAALTGMMLASCSPAVLAGNEVDVDAAARAAQADIDHYASARRQRSVRGAARTTPPQAADTGSSAAARDLVGRYFGAIGAHRPVDAWRAWGHGGADCGRSSEAFAAALTGVTALTAMVGDPGQPDAGGGQRHIVVPATVRAMMSDGATVEARRTLTLRWVADGIDSDDPDAHRWRIVAEGAPAGTALPLPCATKVG